MLKRILSMAAILTCTTLSGAGFAQDKADAGPSVGDYSCKVSREYKMRDCAVEMRSGKKHLVLKVEGHLLLMDGEILENYEYKENKRGDKYVEARLTGERPYVCSTKDAAGAEECKGQRVMISLKKKGKDTWKGDFLVKHYMDRWVGEGEARKISGYDVSVTRIEFTMKKK